MSSSSIRLRKNEQVVGYKCKLCPGLELTEEQLPEHWAYHVGNNARVRKARQDTVSEGNREPDSDNILRREKQEESGNATIRKKAVARQQTIADQKAKADRARKEADRAKVQKEKDARAITSEKNQNLGQKRRKENGTGGHHNRVYRNGQDEHRGNGVRCVRPIRSTKRYDDGLVGTWTRGISG